MLYGNVLIFGENPKLNTLPELVQTNNVASQNPITLENPRGIYTTLDNSKLLMGFTLIPN